MGKWVEALLNADESLALKDDYDSAYEIKFVALFEIKEYQQAYQVLENGLNKCPESFKLLF